MKLLEDFNDITNNKYSYLRLSNITVVTQKAAVVIKLLVPSEMLGSVIKDEEKAEILSAMCKLLPPSLKIDVEYIKSYVDEERATKAILDYFVENHPSIDTKFIKLNVTVIEDIIEVKMTVNKLHYDFIERSIDNLKGYLARQYCNECEVEMIEEMKEIDFDIQFEKPVTAYYYKRRIKISHAIYVGGKPIMIEPKYISDKKADEKGAVYAGKITEYSRRISTKSGNPFYVMTIDDTTERLVIKAFTRSPKSNAYDLLEIGMTVVAQGDISYDTFSNCDVMLVQSLSKCTIDYDSIKVILPHNQASLNYNIVKPYPYHSPEQRNIFEMSEPIQPPMVLLNNQFVVFDVETTGLKLDDTEVIEIAAVKVVEGKITECFSSFCKPSEPITDFITSLTAITNEMVAHSPRFSEVFPDFYKFTRGTVLVAHNSNYDMGYVLREAKKLNYHVDNVVYDTIVLAKSTKNKYSNYKLGTVCEAEGIVNEGAHRAIYDAIATAKFLIKIADKAKF